MTICLMRSRPRAERRADKVELRPTLSAHLERATCCAQYSASPPEGLFRQRLAGKHRKLRKWPNGHFQQLELFGLDSTCPPQDAVKMKKEKKRLRARKQTLNIEARTIRSFLLAFRRAITLRDRVHAAAHSLCTVPESGRRRV